MMKNKLLIVIIGIISINVYSQNEKIKIKSFWIEDMTGLKSLPYEVQSINSNIFNVLFYKGRVFENENWLIVGENRLRPRGANGKLQDYYLTKGK